MSFHNQPLDERYAFKYILVMYSSKFVIHSCVFKCVSVGDVWHCMFLSNLDKNIEIT